MQYEEYMELCGRKQQQQKDESRRQKLVFLAHIMYEMELCNEFRCWMAQEERGTEHWSQPMLLVMLENVQPQSTYFVLFYVVDSHGVGEFEKQTIFSVLSENLAAIYRLFLSILLSSCSLTVSESLCQIFLYVELPEKKASKSKLNKSD